MVVSVGRIYLDWARRFYQSRTRRCLTRLVYFGCCLHCVGEYLVEIVVCSGPSMQPTIQSNDLVLAEHISVLSHKVKKNDVVICRSPKNPQQLVCKRVALTEGETVRKFPHTIVPKGHVWLEGDNSKNSTDSWSYGPVPLGLVRSRVFIRVKEDMSRDCVMEAAAMGSDYPAPCYNESHLWNAAGQLLVAVKENRSAEVVHLVADHGVDVDLQFPPSGLTAVQMAVELGHTETLEALMDLSCSVNLTNWEGESPLHIAVRDRRMDIVRRLLQERASVNTSTKRGLFPLHLAVIREAGLPLINELIKYGAQVDCTDPNGFTPLLSACFRGQNEIVACLLQNGASVDHRDNDGWSVLHYASSLSAATVRLLVQFGAPINQQNQYGSSPLAVLADRPCPRVDIIELLLTAGADPNLCDNSGRNALQVALSCASGRHPACLEVCKLLMKAGAKLQWPTNPLLAHRNSAIYLAATANQVELIHLMIDCGAKLSEEKWLMQPTAADNRIEPELIQYLRELLERERNEPQSLQSQCRLSLKANGLLKNGEIFKRYKLPHILKSFLMFDD